ncbi:MAG TPA: hypothetical protein VEA69_19815 [Tepidisphaeraceae bacterium]|nr:hypothetical protein [Tepidisphaeraceae bacterium]
MSTLRELFDSIRNLCSELYALRCSPRPADADWRTHQLSLNHARTQQLACRDAAEHCLDVVARAARRLPPSWREGDPAVAKYIRLKRALEKVSWWLDDLTLPFKGYKMPMDDDEQRQHDPAEHVADWLGAERTIRELGDELRDIIDLEAANAGEPTHLADKPLAAVSVEAAPSATSTPRRPARRRPTRPGSLT